MKNLNVGLIGTGAMYIERINTKLQGAKVTACADASVAFLQSRFLNNHQ